MTPDERRQRRLAYGKAYRASHKEQINGYHATYVRAHRDKILARGKAYRLANKEQLHAYAANYRLTHKEKIEADNRAYRDSHRKYFWAIGTLKNYGLSIHDFETLLASQGGTCAICKKAEWNNRHPYVDHDHSTGKVRGILCSKCNSALGMIGDNPGIARELANYLERNKKEKGT